MPCLLVTDRCTRGCLLRLAAADNRGVGWSPKRDASYGWALFFVAFIVVASLFMLNLFVSVVVETFSKIKVRRRFERAWLAESLALTPWLTACVGRPTCCTQAVSLLPRASGIGLRCNGDCYIQRHQ